MFPSVSSNTLHAAVLILVGAGIGAAALVRGRAHAPDTTLPEGTLLVAALERSVSTASARAGDSIALRLVHRVRLPEGGEVPANALIRGEVAAVRSGERRAELPELMLRFTALVIDGQLYPIATVPFWVTGRPQPGGARAHDAGPALGGNDTITIGGKELVLVPGLRLRVRVLQPARVPYHPFVE